MEIEINKPKSECEFVNLYAIISEAINAVDKGFPDYFLEPNIMDDAEFEEIMEMFMDYYESERDMVIETIGETNEKWVIAITPST